MNIPAPRPITEPTGSSRWKRWWTAGARAFGALVLPWECPVCGGDGDAEGHGTPFCPQCRAELLAAGGDACPRCASPVGPWAVRSEGCGDCLNRALGFDAAVALGPYRGSVRDLCLSLKHEPNGWVAPWLAGVLLDARPVLRDEAARAPGAVVVPVPLHWRRRWARGYNQAEELARGVADRLKLRRVNPLRRVKATALLAGLGRTERARTLRNAFRIRARQAAAVKGRTVFLVDDVLTTGATCGAAARALKQAGAARVVAVVIARA